MGGDDLRYIISLSRKHYEQIGFIPFTRLEQYLRDGQLWMESENDERCGFMVFGAGWPVLRIHQVCIQYDAQRRMHGVALVGKLISYARVIRYSSIVCNVANDIEANEFWKAVGFSFVRQRIGGKRRKRLINLWSIDVPNPLQGVLPIQREPHNDLPG